MALLFPRMASWQRVIRMHQSKPAPIVSSANNWEKTYIKLCRYGICVGSKENTQSVVKQKKQNMDDTMLKEIMDYKVHGTFP